MERQRLLVVFATIFFNVTGVLIFTRFPGSDWKTGLGLNLVDCALLFIHVFRMRDLLMLRLMFFGLVVGLVELLADAWLVDVTGTLDYSVGGGPMLWYSPIWMPLAWMVVAVQFGYIGMRLLEAMGPAGLIINGILGAINIPFYEEMAYHINWWRYSHCRMISHTPCYIILGEFFIAAALGSLAGCSRQRSLGRVIAAGVLGGLAIFASYAVAYLLWDRLI
jgi:hypothetical protein